MLVQLLGMFAELERETIIDRVIAGMTTKAGKGKWAGGTRPYGYLVDKDTQKLVPYAAEAPTLRDMFHPDHRRRHQRGTQTSHRGLGPRKSASPNRA